MKKEASKVIQTIMQAKQHSTPKAVTFPKEKATSGGIQTHDTAHSHSVYLDRALYKLATQLAGPKSYIS